MSLNVNEGDIPYSYNYVRNSVKVVINAYTGSMKYYVNDPRTPSSRPGSPRSPRCSTR